MCESLALTSYEVLASASPIQVDMRWVVIQTQIESLDLGVHPSASRTGAGARARTSAANKVLNLKHITWSGAVALL